MASHPMGSVPPSEWHPSANLCNRSQLMALMRAGIIAALLLAVLAAIVLF